MKYIKKLLSESTRTTERGEKTKGKSSHDEQPRSTMTKPAIKKRIAAASKIGPKPGQLPEDSHTVYKQMGMLIAEALGLVSEEVKQLPPVPSYKKPGELKKEAEAARKAGQKPAKSPKPDDEAMASAMERDKKMLRKRAGATGSESGSA